MLADHTDINLKIIWLNSHTHPGKTTRNVFSLRFFFFFWKRGGILLVLSSQGYTGAKGGRKQTTFVPYPQGKTVIVAPEGN